jgi:hypothetical protein
MAGANSSRFVPSLTRVVVAFYRKTLYLFSFAPVSFSFVPQLISACFGLWVPLPVSMSLSIPVRCASRPRNLSWARHRVGFLGEGELGLEDGLLRSGVGRHQHGR